MPNNYVLLERIELNTAASSVVFDNIPQTGYTDLKIVVSARTTQTGSSAAGDISIRFNNNSSAVYTYRGITGNGSSATSFAISNDTLFTYMAFADGNDATASTFGNTEIYIPSYLASLNKPFSTFSTQENNATTAYLGETAGLWSNTAAITSITFDANGDSFVAGSSFYIYGIKNS